MQAISNLSEWSWTPFDAMPAAMRRRVYRVPYVQVDDTTGGCLWVTRHGWPLLSHLDPGHWFLENGYYKQGERLSGGSGAVYRVRTAGRLSGGLDLVVKFSRMAQDVPLHVSSQIPHDLPRHVIDSASFNDPFQEFGLVSELRASQFGPSNVRILTKRPLAIYAPGKSYAAWQLGRTETRFRRHQSMLAVDQSTLRDEVPVDMSIERRYIYLYHWVDGVDAETLLREGRLSTSGAAVLVQRVMGDLAAKGFRMLDIKPAHIILRQRHDGSLLQRAGELVYVLVDFELLQRTEPYHMWLQQTLAAPVPPRPALPT